MNQPGDKARVPRWSGDGSLDDRYRRAGQLYDDQVGSALARAYHWRLATFGMMGISVLLIVGLIIQSTKASVVPYIVELDGNAEVRLVGRVTTQDWSLEESVRQAELARWIRNLRSMPADEGVFTQRLAYIRERATQAANIQLDTILEETSPYADLGKARRSVEVGTFTRLKGSSDLWRVEWTEETHDLGGTLVKTQRFLGEFELVVEPPTDVRTLSYNPLGVYVAYFDFDTIK